MDDYVSNCIVLRSIFGSCLSYINKLIPLWHYGIILPEAAEECSLCSLYSLLDLTILELKQILEAYGLITINNNIVKFVCSTSGYGGKYIKKRY